MALFCEKFCGRCRLPNVDTSTGVPNRRAQPLNALFKTRLLRDLSTKDPLFGMNLILDSGGGEIKVGDEIIGTVSS